jgi:hypothetical protein
MSLRRIGAVKRFAVPLSSLRTRAVLTWLTALRSQSRYNAFTLPAHRENASIYKGLSDIGMFDDAYADVVRRNDSGMS